MGMRLNSDRALEVARQLYERHGGDWSQVRQSGRVRADGVIEIARSVLSDEPATPAPTNRRTPQSR